MGDRTGNGIDRHSRDYITYVPSIPCKCGGTLRDLREIAGELKPVLCCINTHYCLLCRELFHALEKDGIYSKRRICFRCEPEVSTGAKNLGNLLIKSVEWP